MIEELQQELIDLEQQGVNKEMIAMLEQEKNLMATPQTNCTNTSWNTRGSAINKIKRNRNTNQPPESNPSQ